MLASILQDVDQGIPHLPRCTQGSRVVPLQPHLATPSERSVDGLREPNRESLRPTNEPIMTVGLHQRMDVIVLDAELKEAEAAS